MRFVRYTSNNRLRGENHGVKSSQFQLMAIFSFRNSIVFGGVKWTDEMGDVMLCKERI